MQMKLELVPIPVSDIERAKVFYVDQLGWNAELEIHPDDEIHFLQLTPPGSACSVIISRGLPSIQMAVGSMRGIHLVVKDLRQSRDELISRGVAMGEIDEHDQGIKYSAFSDPDGNTWTLQEMPWRSADFD